MVLTNDVQKWGPWAGKIITGAESKFPPAIYAVDTNGSALAFNLNIEPEDFDIIPPYQDLYCTDQTAGRLLKVSRDVFTNYWGDLLVTQEGAISGAKLFIVHWDAGTSNFVTRPIPFTNWFEHVTFAPVSLP